MSGPLSGIRVIDTCSVFYGPFAAQILGDLGADVIKVEPLTGDTSRRLGRAHHDDMSAHFLNFNRNKRAVALDLTQAEGRAVLARLVEKADVFMLNLRRKPAAKLGIGYADIARVNPRIVYCACIGYGHRGRYRDRPAYDDLIQGVTGIAAQLGRHLGTDPRYVPTPIADKTSAVYAALAVSSALVHRAKTGEGQEIEVPMFETLTAYTMIDYIYGLTFVPPIGGAGYERTMSPYRRPYKTKDGHICALCYTDRHWQRFFVGVERPDLAADSRFKTLDQRTAHIDELYSTFEKILVARTTAEWFDFFEKADIPVAPLLRGEDLFDDPHVKDVGLFSQVDHPTEGRVWQINVPLDFAKTPAGVRRQAPNFAEHSVEVLREHGFGEAEINRLIEAGVVAARR
ncbi:MAG: CoA transferase [Alphaproteobacteria bacterium]